MSVRRQVKLGNLDIDKIAEIAKQKGHKVQYNSTVELYHTMEECDIVIDGLVGFKRQADGTVDAIYDNMSTQFYAEVITDYIEKTVEDCGDYHVVGKVKTNDWITVYVGR